MHGILLSLFLVCSFMTTAATGKTVEYDLHINSEEVNFTGVPARALTINNSTPGPTIELTEGDLARIRVHNHLTEETSIHWHGILLPNREDGVPYLTTLPIEPGATHLFEFPVKQSGTYWYHSHTEFQEQLGVHGSIVIHPKEETITSDRDYVLVLSDWTDEDPREVMRSLKRGSEYYQLKKKNVQSLTGALRAGALYETFSRSLMRMPPMDISDVGYDLFQINGRALGALPALPGETIRLRIINASSSTYFYLQFAGSPLRIVAADGNNVRPFDLDRLLIAIAETYDVLVTIPAGGNSFEFRATSQDGSGQASVFFGDGAKHLAPDIPKPDLYRIHGMGMHDMGMHDMKMQHPGQEAMPAMDGDTQGLPAPAAQEHHGMTHGEHMPPAQAPATAAPMPAMQQPPQEARPLPPYDQLLSPAPTSLDPANPLREITLTLTGDMRRYVWSFDGRILTEADFIMIRQGENVRLTFVNETMMHHPLHLHGHFFRVLNRHGDYAPLKHTVDVPPMGRQVIEFAANEEKDWFLHCHILYHMVAGMARVIHYEGTEVDADILASRSRPGNHLRHDPWFAWGEAEVLTNMTEGTLTATASRPSLTLDWEKDWTEEEYELTMRSGYNLSPFLTGFGGGHFTEERVKGIAGLQYILPLLISADLWLDTEGEARMTLEKELRLTDRLSAFGESEYDTESGWEWQAGLGWTVSKTVAVIGKYHSEHEAGIGLLLSF